MLCHPVCGEAVTHLDLAALPRTPSLARRQAQAVLGAWKVSPHATETAILMVSELVTNACAAAARTQARTSPRSAAAAAIGLTLRYQPGQVVIEVFDRDPDPPVVTEAGPDAESGRGLTLVQALSKEWSYFYPPSGGKVVYCVLADTTDVGTTEADIAEEESAWRMA